jgi:hypothetical protein
MTVQYATKISLKSEHSIIMMYQTFQYSETYLNQTLNKTESCINQDVNKGNAKRGVSPRLKI